MASAPQSVPKAMASAPQAIAAAPQIYRLAQPDELYAFLFFIGIVVAPTHPHERLGAVQLDFKSGLGVSFASVRREIETAEILGILASSSGFSFAIVSSHGIVTLSRPQEAAAILNPAEASNGVLILLPNTPSFPPASASPPGLLREQAMVGAAAGSEETRRASTRVTRDPPPGLTRATPLKSQVVTLGAPPTAPLAPGCAPRLSAPSTPRGKFKFAPEVGFGGDARGGYGGDAQASEPGLGVEEVAAAADSGGTRGAGSGGTHGAGSGGKRKAGSEGTRGEAADEERTGDSSDDFEQQTPLRPAARSPAGALGKLAETPGQPVIGAGRNGKASRSALPTKTAAATVEVEALPHRPRVPAIPESADQDNLVGKLVGKDEATKEYLKSGWDALLSGDDEAAVAFQIEADALNAAKAALPPKAPAAPKAPKEPKEPKSKKPRVEGQKLGQPSKGMPAPVPAAELAVSLPLVAGGGGGSGGWAQKPR
ncbi:hypothetical protein T492DRAFT_840869 [Pavlovales sp. CCMP2436]|nr:hypothetical protein T492DRAFT_840869 [Pavlovales sp. CCMP2436]